jgi:hypothetical protein
LTGNIRCEVGNGKGEVSEAHNGSDAVALLRVAAPGRIYLYAHGFHQSPRRPRPPLSYAMDTFRGHLGVVRRLGSPYSACLFLSDTAAGFGDHQSMIGDFFFALRAVTDDPELYDQDREIVLVGYSAGVNYIKQAVVTYQKHLRANGIGRVGLAPTRILIVFLGGVHNGASVTDFLQHIVQGVAEFLEGQEREPRNYEEASEQRWRAYQRAEVEALAASRGAWQLERGSPDLVRLNAQFEDAVAENVRILNFVSLSDIVAPPRAADLSFVRSVYLDGLSHWDFVSKATNSLPRDIVTNVYGARDTDAP